MSRTGLVMQCGLLLFAVACDSRAPHGSGDGGLAASATSAASPGVTASAATSAGQTGSAAASGVASALAAAPGFGPAAFPAESATTQAELFALLPPFDAKAERFLRKHVDVRGPGSSNQGNAELAQHGIARQRCRDGLAGVTLQTATQKARCGGRENMVPLYPDGDPSKATTCIDIFEFPNRPCELPFVWTGATIGREICRRVGKRLCKQQEWVMACEGDPAGGKPRRYAYGDQLDIKICHTSRSTKGIEPACDPNTVMSTWKTCPTNTEPAGAFPGCRSRFGVYDLHGNVAEAMTRFDHEEGKTVSQLKGSAFFYVDVQREEGAKRTRETYPDHCRYDPRWHVQPMSAAWHVNYHLGFRCCADATPEASPASD